MPYVLLAFSVILIIGTLVAQILVMNKVFLYEFEKPTIKSKTNVKSVEPTTTKKTEVTGN